jgi:hypothetical protein
LKSAAVICPLAAKRAASSRWWLFTSWQVRNSSATACAKSGRFKWYRFGMSFFAHIPRIVQSQTGIGIIGHPEAGERSAVIYTRLGSCHRHGINPFDYLRDLFTRLPAANITQFREFAPAAWAKAKAREKEFAQAA